MNEGGSFIYNAPNKRHFQCSPAVVSLQPYCDQIDQVEASVSALEQTAYRLDAYCKRLGECDQPCLCAIITKVLLSPESKFRDLEKR